MPSFSMGFMIQPSLGRIPALSWNSGSLLTVLWIKTHFLSHCFPGIWSCKVPCFGQKQGKPVAFSWQKVHLKSPGSLGTGIVCTLVCRHSAHRDEPLSTSAFEHKASLPEKLCHISKTKEVPFSVLCPKLQLGIRPSSLNSHGSN